MPHEWFPSDRIKGKGQFNFSPSYDVGMWKEDTGDSIVLKLLIKGQWKWIKFHYQAPNFEHDDNGLNGWHKASSSIVSKSNSYDLLRFIDYSSEKLYFTHMLGKFFQKPTQQESDRVPPGQYLTKGFPVLTYGATPRVNIEGWEFRVWGLATPRTFTWSDFMELPHHEFTADFHCVTRWSKLDVKWTGIKVTDFMKSIEVDPKAAHVMEHCYGGYTTNISMEDFVKEENFFAFQVFGEPLPAEHGGPLRLVVPHLYAWKSAKWINGLEFLEKEDLGFWERNGYHRRGEPWVEERYSG